MLRDLDRLRRVAMLMEHDLRATVPGDWSCEVSQGFVLVIRSPHGIAEVALDDRVDEEARPAEAWSARYRDGTLNDDAAEAVAEEVQEVLRCWGLRWPICRQHGAQMTGCSDVWAVGAPLPMTSASWVA